MAKSGGSYQPGQSGNPAGRPAIVREVRDLAQQYTVEAIEGLAAVLRDEKAPPSARVSAAIALLDRGWGRAPQNINIRGTIEQFVIDIIQSLDDRAEERELGEDDDEPGPVRH